MFSPDLHLWAQPEFAFSWFIYAYNICIQFSFSTSCGSHISFLFSSNSDPSLLIGPHFSCHHSSHQMQFANLYSNRLPVPITNASLLEILNK